MRDKDKFCVHADPRTLQRCGKPTFHGCYCEEHARKVWPTSFLKGGLLHEKAKR